VKRQQKKTQEKLPKGLPTDRKKKHNMRKFHNSPPGESQSEKSKEKDVHRATIKKKTLGHITEKDEKGKRRSASWRIELEGIETTRTARRKKGGDGGEW